MRHVILNILLNIVCIKEKPFSLLVEGGFGGDV
jgi:hypothetical protein